MRTEGLPLAGLGLVTLALGALFWPVFAGEVCGDDNSFHLAESAFIAQAVKSGDWNGWNPWANGGYASGYYYQIVPSALPGLLAGATGAPVLFWFQLTVFLCLVLVPAAVYRALRVVGAERWAALGGALCVPFVLSGSKWGTGPEALFGLGLFSQAVAMGAFPLALAHGWRWTLQGRGAAAAVLWGLFAGLSHPVIGVALGLGIGASLVTAGRGWLKALGRLATLAMFLVLGAASAWGPAVIDSEAFGGLPPRPVNEAGTGFRVLAQWLVNGQLLDMNRRAGPVLALLLVPSLALAVATLRRRPQHPLVLIWVCALTFSFILGVGPAVQLELFPGVRLIAPLQVTLAMAVGVSFPLGLQWALTQGRRITPRGSLGIKLALGAGTAMAAFFIVVPGAAGHRLLTRVAADFAPLHREELEALIAPMENARPGRYQNWRGSAARSAADSHWFVALPYVQTGRGQLVARGAAAVQSTRNFAFLDRRLHPARAAWIYDAPLVITDHQAGPALGGAVLASTEHFELRELPAPGLVSAVQVVGELPPGRREATNAGLVWQASEQPFKGQVLAHPGHGGPGPPPDGEVLGYARGPSSIRAEVVARSPTTFLVHESWHPRWRARVDGAPAIVRRVSPDMIAVDVGPGAHRLELQFQRPGWWWALWLLVPLSAVAGRVLERRLVGMGTQTHGTS